MVLTEGPFTRKFQLNNDSRGPMIVPSVFDRKPCFANMERFMSCTVWSVVTMKPILQYFGITPGSQKWNCVGFFVNNFFLDDSA